VGSQQLLTVQRAIAYLLHLAGEGPTSVPRMAEHFGVPVSTAYRYVAALKDAGLVWVLPGGALGLGPRCVQLETSFRQSVDSWSPYRAVMGELARITGETVALLVPLEHEAVCIDTVESDQPLRYTFSKGVAKPMLRGASTKVMLPYLPDHCVEALFERDTVLGPEGRVRLMADLPRIRQQGYAVSREEVDQGVWAVGVPVLNDSGKLEGALSIIAPIFRVEGREAFLIRATLEATKQMPSILGTEMDLAV